MVIHALTTLMALMCAASARDSSKNIKSVPGITNSFVNLGKIDISYHFNTKNSDFPTKPDQIHAPSTYFPKTEAFIELPCPCSNLRNIRDPLVTNPSQILKKLLMSNDLFTFDKEPVTSTLCCDSHERVQEDTIYFEIEPKKGEMNIFPLVNNALPNLFYKDFPKRPALPTVSAKPKANIDIYFFPKKQDTITFDFIKSQNDKKKNLKENIQIVGDKELKNSFKNYKIKPSAPITSSVKKDLYIQEKKEERTPEEPKVTITPYTGAPNAI